MRTLLLCALLLGLLFIPACIFDNNATGPRDGRTDYMNPAAGVEERVADLLSRMTLQEKIGQMTQAERGALYQVSDIRTLFLGSVLSGGGSSPGANNASAWADMTDGFQQQALQTRLAIPLIYGIDAVHGHNNVYGAVIFPHNIGMGCTRDPDLVREAAEVTAAEVSGTGIHWTFSPCIAVVRDERWGRTYEGFGETPELAEMMAAAAVEGLQGVIPGEPGRIVACPKHFLGDGGTLGGDDQGNTVVSEAELRAIHLPGYEAAVRAGAGTVMASYSSWNGVKMHGSRYLLTDVLKGELGFDGFVVSDWAGIDQLSGGYEEDVEQAINAGIDMVMVPTRYREFITALDTLVDQGRVPMERIDDAVSRILRIKFRFGLFEAPFADRTEIMHIGSAAHREVARRCVRQSLVLLKNDGGRLPFTGSETRIHVAGRNADDIGAQCGGWTISWQGGRGPITIGTTIYRGIAQRAPAGTVVTYSPDGSGAAGSDIAVAVIGEDPYAEGAGDRADLSLSDADVTTVKRLKQAGVPVVAVLVSGRPMILEEILDDCDGLIAAWLPGTEGRGVADVLFGDVAPTGTLSHSWPLNMAQIPVNEGDGVYNPLFPYGFGLTYE
ncbi:glycoside hydrolase family 3 C-terminal domain-containing protein [bacterium]|nr:glycoside hydrolase family 3 C-terminal domain-containing protein [bacterium]